MSFERTIESQVQKIADKLIKQKISDVLNACATLEGEFTALELKYTKPIAALNKEIQRPGIGDDIPVVGFVVNALVEVREPAAKLEENKAPLVEELDRVVLSKLSIITNLERTIRELELLDSAISSLSKTYDKPVFDEAKKQLQAMRKMLGKIITDNGFTYKNLPDTDLVLDHHYACIDQLFNLANQALKKYELEEAKAYVAIAQKIVSPLGKIIDKQKAVKFLKDKQAIEKRIKLLSKSMKKLDAISKEPLDSNPISITYAAAVAEGKKSNNDLEYHQQMVGIYQDLLDDNSGFAKAEKTSESVTSRIVKIEKQLKAKFGTDVPAVLSKKNSS